MIAVVKNSRVRDKFSPSYNSVSLAQKPSHLYSRTATHPVSFCLTVSPCPCASLPYTPSALVYSLPIFHDTYRYPTLHHKPIRLVKLADHRLALYRQPPVSLPPHIPHARIGGMRNNAPSTSADPSAPSASAPVSAGDHRHSCSPGTHPSRGAWRIPGSCRRQTGFPGAGAVGTVSKSLVSKPTGLSQNVRNGEERHRADSARASETRVYRIGGKHTSDSTFCADSGLSVAWTADMARESAKESLGNGRVA